MHRSRGGRLRSAFAGAAVLALALLTAGPAHAAGGTPTTPTELFNANQSCSTDPTAPVYLSARGGLDVQGIANDTDTTLFSLNEQFQAWPVTNPTQITTGTVSWATPGNEAETSLSAAAFTDGQTYAWQARTVDANGVASAWSAPCYVADDDTAPAVPPTVSSPNYPQGKANQPGAPIQIDLGANGVSDVAGYEYSWYGDFSVPVATIGPHGVPQPEDPFANPAYAVRASSLGGPATVKLIPPAGGGLYVLTVASVDRAWNQSPPTRYWIWVKSAAPTVTQLSNNPVFGKQASFKLTADPNLQAASPVTSFTVQDITGPSPTSTTTVKADANGTAEYSVPLTGTYGDILLVSTTSADGWVSNQQWWTNGQVDTTPTVKSDVYVENGSSGGVGVPSTFTFAPKVKGVASYTYALDWGQGATVKADGQGNAQISWTPTQSGWYDLTVYATTKDGVQLAAYDYFFTVN